MTKTRKVIGKVSVPRDYVDGETYYLYNVVSLYGSAFMCMVESTTTSPATLGDDGKPVIGEGWRFFADCTDIYDAVKVTEQTLTDTQKEQVRRNIGTPAASRTAASLGAIAIKTSKTPTDKAANKAAIKAYVDNLTALGVDTTKGYTIPICFSNTKLGYVMYHPLSAGSKYTGIVTGPGGASSNVAIEESGYAYITTNIQPVESSRLTTTVQSIVPAINEVNAIASTNRADLARTMSRVASPDDRALPLLCGQPPILFGAGTPKETVVPENWNQYDPATGEGYNWNGKPSAIGQQYVDTTAASGGRYIAARNGEWDLKWINC